MQPMIFNGRSTPPYLQAVVYVASCTGFAACGEKTAVGPAAPAPLRITAFDNPADSGSAQPDMTLSPVGVPHLSWLERRADSPIPLRYAVRKAESWSEVRDVDTGETSSGVPETFRLCTSRPTAGLSQSGSARMVSRATNVVRAHSGAKGITWIAPRFPHRGVTAMERSFASWRQLGDTNALVWVDGRGNENPDKVRRMTQLTYATLDSAGNPKSEVFLDTMICDRCHTSAVNEPGGAVVVHRNRVQGEIRDINAIRFAQGAWKAPLPVHVDGWHIEGHPVNGPAVSAVGALAVAWCTTANDSTRVRLAFSDDTAQTFGAPVDINEGFHDAASTHRVDTACIEVL
jgi:hypothetical protein